MATLTTAIRNILGNALAAALAGGSVKLHTSAHDVVVSAPLNATAFGAASGGVITMATTPNAVEGTVTPAGTSTINHAHFCDSTGTEVAQVSVGLTNSSAELKLANLDVVQGNLIQIANWAFTVPAS